MKYRIEHLDMHGDGSHRMRVYDLPGATITLDGGQIVSDYWVAVTDVPCPRDGCTGTIRWNEAGYVPGYRICDSCGHCFFARGSAEKPTLTLD